MNSREPKTELVSPLARVLIYRGLLVVILSVALSCGGPNSTGAPDATTREVQTPTPTPINPQALLEQSGAAMTDLESFHFRLEHNTGGTPLVQNLSLISADGYVAKPNKLSLEFTGSVGNFAMRGNLITVDGRTFMTNPLNDEWQTLQGQVSPLAFFDPAKGISGMMSQVTGPTVTEVHANEIHLVGRLPVSALAPLFGTTADGVINIELTINTPDLYLTKVVLDGRITETELDGVVRTITLDQFNEPTIIEPPR